MKNILFLFLLNISILSSFSQDTIDTNKVIFVGTISDASFDTLLLKDVKVTIKNRVTNLTYTYITNDKGEFMHETNKLNTFLSNGSTERKLFISYKISLEKEGYFAKVLDFKDMASLSKKIFYLNKLFKTISLEKIGCTIGSEYPNIDELLFDKNKSHLSTKTKKELDKMVVFLNQYPKRCIEYAGHSSFDEKNKEELSENRAKSVLNYLMTKKIEKDRLKISFYGSKILKEKSPQKQHLNRRVEFLYIAKRDVKEDN